MGKKIFTFLNKEFHGVNEAALLLGGFSFLSQILGLIRDRTLANVVGAGSTLDIYYAAFRIPDFLYLSIASLASITVLMPFLMEKMDSESDSKEKARKFLNNIFSAYMLFMVAASLLIVILMPYIGRYIAPGFSEIQLSALTTMSRIMLLSPIFIGLSNLLGTVTQLFKNFLIFSLSPVFYNIGILTGIIFLYPVCGVYGLGLGVIIGALLHLLIQVPTVINHGLFPRFTYRIAWGEVWSVMKLSLPRTLTLSCNSLAFIILIAMASTLKSGSISLFTFAYNLQSVPVGIIGISYSVAAFPILVKSFSAKDMGKFVEQMTQASRQIIFWSLPVAVLLVVLRAQIVRVALGSHGFSWSDTRLTAASVALFILSLASQGLVLLLVRGYYATGNTRKPLIINVFSSAMVVVFATLFIHLFKVHPGLLLGIESLLRVSDVSGTIMLALPLAYALGSLLNFFLLWVYFKRDFLTDTSSKIFRTFIESVTSAFVIGVVSYFALDLFDNVFNINTLYGIFMQGLLAGLVGISFGIFTLAMLKNKELEDLLKALGNKFWRNRVLAPEQKEL